MSVSEEPTPSAGSTHEESGSFSFDEEETTEASKEQEVDKSEELQDPWVVAERVLSVSFCPPKLIARYEGPGARSDFAQRKRVLGNL